MRNIKLALILSLIISLSFSGYLLLKTSNSEISSKLVDAEKNYQEKVKEEIALNRELTELKAEVKDKTDNLNQLKEDIAKTNRIITQLEADLSLDKSVSETNVPTLEELVSKYGLTQTLDACYFALYEGESFNHGQREKEFFIGDVIEKYKRSDRYFIGSFSYIHWLYYCYEFNLFKEIKNDWIITQLINLDRSRREVYVKLGDHYYMKSLHNLLNAETDDEFYIQGDWIDVTDSISEEGLPSYNTMKNLLKTSRSELYDS